MKKRYLFLLLLVVAPLTYANTESKIPTQTFHFSYTYEGKNFSTQINEHSIDDAIEKGSMECFNYFTHAKNNEQKVKMQEDQALDIIDICANPKKA